MYYLNHFIPSYNWHCLVAPPVDIERMAAECMKDLDEEDDDDDSALTDPDLLVFLFLLKQIYFLNFLMYSTHILKYMVTKILA